MVKLDQKTRPFFWRNLAGLWPGAVRGALAGTVAALVTPSIFVLGSFITQKLTLGFAALVRGRVLGPYLQSFIRPENFFELLIAALVFYTALNGLTLWSFLRRYYAAAAGEAEVLWAVSAYVLWIDHGTLQRLFLFVVALLLTIAIASVGLSDDLTVKPFLSPDRPIGKVDSEDDLDRTRLADSLVDRITLDDIPVLAIVGAYGDGKTSLLELMTSRLRKRGAVLVRFKTSLPGDESTLVSSLFNSIATELHHRFFVRRLRTILNRYARILAGLVPSLPSGARDVFNDPSQEQELEELSIRLKRLPVNRVIVLLDDMDRMQRGELQTLLKIIRGIENYPKLCFVCAFNKDALVETLLRVQEVERVSLSFSTARGTPISGTARGEISADDTQAGYQFLEKFFPVQIPIPKLDHKQLARQFDKYFDEFASHYGLLALPEEQKAFEERFRSLWPSVFRPALHNIRKMKTFFNALKLSFGLVREEVDLMDFMCIELLRQEEPAIYEAVYKYRKFFYYPSWDIELFSEQTISEDEARAQHRQVFDDIFRRLYGTKREHVLSLLEEMFLKVGAYREEAQIALVGGNEEEADQQKRIFHPYYFMIYFSLHVPEGYYSIEEFKRLISFVNGRGADEVEEYLRGYLRKMNDLQRMRFFERIVAAHSKLQDVAAKALVAAVAHESETLQISDFGIGDFNAAMHVVFVIANRFSGTDEIMTILKGGVSKASTDAFAQRLLAFTLDRKSTLITRWEHINDDAIRAEFALRMKERYRSGSGKSIYAAPTYHHWQALVSWYRINPEDTREYLTREFETHPASIGKHLLWLFPSLTHSADGKRFVDELFPLAELKKLAIKFGDKAYSGNDEQRKIIDRLLKDDLEGGWPY